MPRLDLILLPLLGGYIFLITFNLTRHYHQRIEKQRLVYNSLVSAFLLGALVYLFDFFVLKQESGFRIFSLQVQPVVHYRKQAAEFMDAVLNNPSVPGLKHALLVLLFSYPLAKLLNIFISRQFAFDYTIQRWGSQFDRVIWTSLTEKRDEDKLLMISTKSNKVYIGYVNKLSEPIGESHITILPNFSGYRNRDNLKVRITTNYTAIIRKYISEDKTSEIDDKLGVILPVSEILSISRFDIDLFAQFNEVTTKSFSLKSKLKSILKVLSS